MNLPTPGTRRPPATPPRRRRPTEVPLFSARVPAGFPSPAEGYLQEAIDPGEFLIQNQPATFVVRAEGESMIHAPIQNGDYLVVDRSLQARDGDVVLAALDGDFTVKRLRLRGGRAWLQPENPAFPDTEITEEREAVIWGVVSGSFRRFARKPSHADP